MIEDLIEDLSKLFSHGQQMWLLGAGSSFESNLPLVRELTDRVRIKLADVPFEGDAHLDTKIGHVVEGIRADIGEAANIEDVLDHLADHLSIAHRSASESAVVNILPPEADARSELFSYKELRLARTRILETIRDTLRWGYVHSDNPETIRAGSSEEPILCIDHHESFVDVLFTVLRAGRQLRVQPIEFFTTNYDTLIEDALALKAIAYHDGFRGGAVAYWDATINDGSTAPDDAIRASVTKIHGSIDWVRVGERIVRRRIADSYPKGYTDLLIYPQALKYDLAQREPFDTLFQRFRTSLNRPIPQVLLVCGYGFGDDHVDQEMELALKREDSQLTIIACSQKHDGKPAKWQGEWFGERVYMITEDGIWRGDEGPFFEPAAGQPHKWWTFTGMTAFLHNPGGAL